MKKLAMVSALAMASTMGSAHGAVLQGFTGPLAPATWTVSHTGNVIGNGNGGVTSFTPTTLTFVGGDDPNGDLSGLSPSCAGAITGDPGACQINIAAAAILAPFTFTWSYSTADVTAGNDIFGVVIDGIFKDLSDPGGALSQTNTFTANPTRSFAFAINCTDCVGGAATVSITAFSAVPEPGTIALFSLGMLIVGVVRQKRYLARQRDRYAA
jgi:hypothetical protein